VFCYFSDAGAGGEKVLWSAVSAIQRAKGQLGKKDANIRIHIYSGSQMNPEDILEQKVRQRFGINIHPENLEFVTIDQDLHNALDPKNYPSFTMVW
jgi:alpha-1,2-mannosyltransferase